VDVVMTLANQSMDAGQGLDYFDNHYSQDDYYTRNQRCAGRWTGRGAALLGLGGEVRLEDFDALLHGRHPRTGEILVAPAAGTGEHAAGWDCVFNAPKSVSIQALVGGDDRLIRAHIDVVEQVMGEVETYALARRHGGREYMVSGNVVAAAFDHLAARPTDDPHRVPDPHLHTHVPLLNITLRVDGRWCALSPIEIYRTQTFATALYRALLVSCP
jgi:conjugative relaxase-like TrwC/TraI family protein